MDIHTVHVYLHTVVCTDVQSGHGVLYVVLWELLLRRSHIYGGPHWLVLDDLFLFSPRANETPNYSVQPETSSIISPISEFF